MRSFTRLNSKLPPSASRGQTAKPGVRAVAPTAARASVLNSSMYDWKLSQITYHAERISYSAARITNMPSKLDYQEPFPTKMEAALARTEAELIKALESVRGKLVEYRKLPKAII